MLTKENVLQTFDTLPEEFTLDELIDRLMVIKKNRTRPESFGER